ncbi:MAG: hypothetical protein H7Z37_15990, partial [Pyrinomonadaceae bacterium]|nr:hypothetical protein [Pyrinomonadaceae bacterium]
ILISRERAESQITVGESAGGSQNSGVSDEEFNSELELVKSSDVVTGAVRDLSKIKYNPPPLTEKGKLRESLKKRFRDFMGYANEEAQSVTNKTLSEEGLESEVSRVESGLSVEPAKKSRVIKVTYRDVDPIRAKLTLESVFQKYQELHLQIKEEPQTTKIFADQSTSFNNKLNASTEALKRFDLANNLNGAESNTQREFLLKQLYDSQTQSSATRTELTETSERVKILEKQIAEQPEQIQTSSTLKYVSALDGMKTELSQLEQQKIQLSQKYQPTSRFVTDITARIQKLQDGIARESANPPQEKSFAVNDLRRRLVSDLYAAKSSLGTLVEREKSLSGLISKYAAEVEKFNTKSIERQRLERELNLNQEAYVLYQKKARENEISQALNNTANSKNFVLIDSPKASSAAVTPKPTMNFLVLLLVGSFAGLVCAVLVENIFGEKSNELILQSGDLEQRIGLPVLAIIPVMQSSNLDEMKFENEPDFYSPPPLKRVKGLLSK